MNSRQKFAQKVLRWVKRPSITATSLPDDYVHYNQPRSLTVREWARLQTFPIIINFLEKELLVACGVLGIQD